MSVPPVRVLLVEDDPDDALFFMRAVSRLGLPWELEVAEDGEKAVTKLWSGDAPNYVVLDLKIPRTTGLEVLERLRADPARAGTRVVILTSSTERKDVETAIRLGVDQYYTKPVGLKALVNLVAEIALLWGISCNPGVLTADQPDSSTEQ